MAERARAEEREPEEGLKSKQTQGKGVQGQGGSTRSANPKPCGKAGTAGGTGQREYPGPAKEPKVYKNRRSGTGRHWRWSLLPQRSPAVVDTRPCTNGFGARAVRRGSDDETTTRAPAAVCVTGRRRPRRPRTPPLPGQMSAEAAEPLAHRRGHPPPATRDREAAERWPIDDRCQQPRPH